MTPVVPGRTGDVALPQDLNVGAEAPPSLGQRRVDILAAISLDLALYALTLRIQYGLVFAPGGACGLFARAQLPCLSFPPAFLSFPSPLLLPPDRILPLLLP